MTLDEILSAAKEAGSVTYSPPPMRAVRGRSFTFDQLEAFAKIIERRTIERCAELVTSGKYMVLNQLATYTAQEHVNNLKAHDKYLAAAIRKLGEE